MLTTSLICLSRISEIRGSLDVSQIHGPPLSVTLIAALSLRLGNRIARVC
jgi:hypothetical protein